MRSKDEPPDYGALVKRPVVLSAEFLFSEQPQLHKLAQEGNNLMWCPPNYPSVLHLPAIFPLVHLVCLADLYTVSC